MTDPELMKRLSQVMAASITPNTLITSDVVNTPAVADFEQGYKQGIEKAEQAYREYAEEHYKKPNYVVVQHANPMDDNSPVEAAYPLTDLCGFAWLEIDGRDPFWRWMKRSGKVDKNDSPKYIKLHLSMGNGGNGDITAQEKAYQAFADHVRKITGAKIYSTSRLD